MRHVELSQVQGFTTYAVAAGIKPKATKLDLACIVSQVPCVAAGVFTQNSARASCVDWSQQAIRQPIRAVVVNSGNANACTGPQGLIDTQAMAAQVAQQLGCEPQQVAVASTGVIGVPLPMDRMQAGIDALFSPQASQDIATAIMTTDTVPKKISCQFQLSDGHSVALSAVAKGSGMIHPNMATMLGFIVSDIAMTQPVLQQALSEANQLSFNRISVDGDTSTNDMVLLLANGMANNAVIDSVSHPDYALFCQQLTQVCQHLAQAIVRDGEGATKFLTMHVHGAPDVETAETLGKAMLTSSLVKTAFFGQDANWGRLIAAMGNAVLAGPVALDGVTIMYHSQGGALTLLEAGKPVAFDEAVASKVMAATDIDVTIQLNQGSAEATLWGCDLSHDYVSINADYRS